jgi:pyridoxamine 5'-phosphate oxidase
MLLNIENFREDYRSRTLEMENTFPDPFQQFTLWMEETVAAKILEPNAMTLSTVNSQGRPSARIVLLKGLQDGAFVFYTNYDSQKAQDLAVYPFAALTFLWKEAERQVRIEGKIEKVSAEESTRYFQSRPKGSQIGAWASPQSQVIPNRQVLEEAVQKLETTYQHKDILPLPPNWGGYALVPDMVEFWQGRSSRLHDRIRYRLGEHGEWMRERLAP